MHVLILGGGGFLGRRLAATLLENGGLYDDLDGLVLVDMSFAERVSQDKRLTLIEGDISDETIISRALEHRPELIFHLAAVVSGEAEKNPDLGIRVNLWASWQLLEACRKRGLRPRLVFASSCAIFGGDVSQTITDDTAPKPRSAYGTQKAMVELLISDYTRRGVVDGRSLRLPTIAVRPGKPNAAASSFVSAIIREPLNGRRVTYPVPADTVVWIQSPGRVIENFVHAANLEPETLGEERSINLPGLNVSIRELIESLEQIAGPDVTALISHEPDAFLQNIVLTWPPHFATHRARQLGFAKDASAAEVIQLYMQEEKNSFINNR